MAVDRNLGSAQAVVEAFGVLFHAIAVFGAKSTDRLYVPAYLADAHIQE